MSLTTVKGSVLNRGVNVKDFGAVGDGITDDSAALSAAFAIGGDVYVPQGTYYASSEIAVTSNNLHIHGPGTIKGNASAPSGSSILSFNGNNDITIKDITIDQNNISSGRSISLTSVSDVTIDNVIGKNVQQAFIMGSGLITNLTVNGCKSDTKGYGVLIQDPSVGSMGLLATNNIFEFPYGSGVGDGVEINAPTNGFSNAIIANNKFSGFYGAASNAGIGVGIAKVTNALIFGNVITGCDGDGIHVEDHSSNVVVSENIVSDCCKSSSGSSGSIAVLTGTENVTINSNVVTNSNTKACFATTSSAGDFCSNLILKGNRFKTSDKFVVSLESVKKCVVVDNIIDDGDTSLTGGQALIRITKFITNISDQIIIDSNVMSDGTNPIRSISISPSSATNVKIKDNDFQGCSTPSPDLGTGNAVDTRANKISSDVMTGTFVLTAAATSKTINNGNVYDTSHIDIFPLNAAAAGMSGVYASAVTKAANFTITHPAAAGGETFGYRIE